MIAFRAAARGLPLWKRAQLYTGRAGALRPAGSPLQGADDFRRFSICSNHHRGSYTSPALAAASYPFVDLLPENTLRYKLFPFSKFYNRPLYFSETMKYNEVNDKLEFIKES